MLDAARRLSLLIKRRFSWFADLAFLLPGGVVWRVYRKEGNIDSRKGEESISYILPIAYVFIEGMKTLGVSPLGSW